MATLVYEDFYSLLEALKVTVTVFTENDSKFVQVDSPLYKNKQYRLPLEYSTEYSDYDILNSKNVINLLSSKYGIYHTSGFANKFRDYTYE